jgi:predicted permease
MNPRTALESLLGRWRKRLRLLLRKQAVERELDEELAFHIAMETEKNRRAGLSVEEARRQAMIAFGGVERHKEEVREARVLGWVAGMSLDLKLGLRMLVKYPGLTMVGVVGMAVAVAIGAIAFSIISTIVDPGLPLDDGGRVVAIQTSDPTPGSRGGPPTRLHDLAVWREALTAVELLSAYRTVERNLIPADGHPETVSMAEMTASGFRVARVPPLLGRHLLDDDDRKGAPAVAVIGQALWQRRFGGDSAIVGRTVRLGAARHTIVGVMPQDFGFPVDNEVWTPLRLDPLDFALGEAPVIEVFGRLAPAATLEDAQTQLTTVAGRLAAAHPETHTTVRASVMPYPSAFISGWARSRPLELVQVLVTMLLVLIGTNVAILVYARTANRAGEIAVRSALGASRGRIVGQLFAEALLLCTAAAAVGLVFARFALRQVDGFVFSQYLARERGAAMPFWVDLGISPGVVLYAAGLAVLAAVIVGVVPALKATRHRVHAGLQQLGIAGSGMQLGRSWTVLIVAQVAAAVAILPVAFHGIDVVMHATSDPVVATKGLLAATLHLDRVEAGTDDGGVNDDEELRTRLAQRRAELVRRLEAEPGVANVFLDDGPPFPSNRVWSRIHIDDAGATASGDSASASRPVRQVAINVVDADYLETFAIPLLAGRRFQPGDVSGSAHVAIVEQAFVDEFLRGGAALGRQVRRVTRTSSSSGWVPSGPWHEIVGVVADFPVQRNPSGDERPRMYLPLSGATNASRLIVQVRSDDPAAFAGRLGSSPWRSIRCSDSRPSGRSRSR